MLTGDRSDQQIKLNQLKSSGKNLDHEGVRLFDKPTLKVRTERAEMKHIHIQLMIEIEQY